MVQRILFCLLFLLPLFGVEALQAQQTPPTDSLWGRANAAYLVERYAEAQADYELILTQEVESAHLFYNLANSYFKQGENAQAILNYHRALRLDPSYEDAAYNLTMANALVQDKIEVIPTPFYTRWVVSLNSLFSSNVWSLYALLCVVLAVVLLFLYLFAGSLKWRKIGFYGALSFVVLFVCSMSASVAQYRAAMLEDGAIILSSTAPVKSSPDRGSKDLFVLHAGTLVEVKGELGEYREIQLSDGNKGWILASAIEMIR